VKTSLKTHREKVERLKSRKEEAGAKENEYCRQLALRTPKCAFGSVTF